MSYDMNLGGSSLNASVSGGIFAFLGGMLLFVILISLAISVFYIIVYWKLFKKAHQEGWASIIPIYNIIIMLKIAKMPMWWLALIFIPGVNFIGSPLFMIIWSLNIAKVFGKDTTFGVLTIFFGWVTLPVLAFGDAQYIETDESIDSEKVISEQSNNNQNYSQPVNNTSPESINNQNIQQEINPILPEQTSPTESTQLNQTDNNINNVNYNNNEMTKTPTWDISKENTTQNQDNNSTNL